MRDLFRSSRHIFWRSRQDRVMSDSDVEKVEMSSSGKVEMPRVEIVIRTSG